MLEKTLFHQAFFWDFLSFVQKHDIKRVTLEELKLKIGLNEVAIGMTMHQAGIELARNRVPINYLTRSVINAELFDPQTAVLAGFLDQVVESDTLMATANRIAVQMPCTEIVVGI